MTWLLELLNRVPFAGLMLVVALGYAIGRPGRRGVTLTPAGGVLVVGLVLGWLGLDLSGLYGVAPGSRPRMTVGGFGLALFIYAIGFEAGPRFLSALRGSGLRLVAVGAVLNGLAVVLAVAGGRLLGLSDVAAAGALAGSLTSTPALVAAAALAPRPGVLTIHYAVTYPVGQLGLLALVRATLLITTGGQVVMLATGT